MAPTARLGALLVSVLAVSAVALAETASSGPPLVNWSAPATYTVPRPSGAHPLAIQGGELTGGPLPFFPVTPCRQYDSRNATPLPDNTSRTITLSGAPCGIPATAAAVSVNITIFNITGAPSNGVFRVGIVSPPPTAWINFPPTETQRGNAGIVALDGSGNIIVQVNSGAGHIDLTCDVNGYYYNGNGFLSLMPTGDSFVIQGNYSGGGVISAVNFQGSATNSYGIFGLSLSNGNGSAGVKGIDSGGSFPTDPNLAAVGVRGESKNDVGVLGLSQITGVIGFLVTASGLTSSGGVLGDNFDSGGPWGVFALGKSGASGPKSFVEVHPTDPNKSIRYVSLEGPEAGTYFRGRARFSHGWATIDVPESFRLVTDEEGLSVQVTPIGEPVSFAVVKVGLDQIVVRASKDTEFFYLVNGVRQTFKDWQVIVDGGYMPKSPQQKLPGYFSEEQKRRLIANGTYNADGTVNMETAERVGWTNLWAEREAQAQAAAREAQKAAIAKQR
jgi:hypothetical protein